MLKAIIIEHVHEILIILFYQQQKKKGKSAVWMHHKFHNKKQMAWNICGMRLQPT
jgi:hypothetical protein